MAVVGLPRRHLFRHRRLAAGTAAPTAPPEACSRCADFWLGPKAAARGYRLDGFDSIGSTNDRGARAATAGDAGDIWFAALQQTAGRGRRGRQWETAHGNLAASLLIVPDADPAIAATLGFVAGVALNRALRTIVPEAHRQGRHRRRRWNGRARIALKWPNDVLADGAKLAGILLEAQTRPDGRMAIVIGFGVNIVAAPDGLPYPGDLACRSWASTSIGRGRFRRAQRCLGRRARSSGTAARHRRNSDAVARRRRRHRRARSRSTATATSCAASSKASTTPDG